MVSAPSSSIFHYLLVLALLSAMSSAIDDRLCHFHTGRHSLSDPLEGLKYLVSFSLDRARHLKNPEYSSTISVQLISNFFGAYTIPLNFGTPPQTLSFVMDTGSNFVWSPCTSHYLCKNCSTVLRTPTSKIPTFFPKKSSSTKVVSCKNPKCSWLHPGTSQCDEDNSTCSPYFILYGSGSTGGVPITDTLRIKQLTVPDFLVGCSVVSTGQAAGIAGFGRGLASLPSQLNLNKFSYCSFSFKSVNNQSIQNSVLLDYTQTGSDKKTDGMMYTPFIKNPEVQDMQAYLAYYYVGLRRITLGGRKVKIPYRYLAPSQGDGNGGTVIDSGSTFTFMSRGAFEPLNDMLISQMKVRGYERNIDAEDLNGIGPCFDIPGKNVSFPDLRFHFKGGTEFTLPDENYMASVGTDNTTIVCLAVITDQGGDEGGPGIILGNFQLQNYYVEFDLENERLGFRRERC